MTNRGFGLLWQSIYNQSQSTKLFGDCCTNDVTTVVHTYDVEFFILYGFLRFNSRFKVPAYTQYTTEVSCCSTARGADLISSQWSPRWRFISALQGNCPWCISWTFIGFRAWILFICMNSPRRFLHQVFRKPFKMQAGSQFKFKQSAPSPPPLPSRES